MIDTEKGVVEMNEFLTHLRDSSPFVYYALPVVLGSLVTLFLMRITSE
jgi:hypothetical protein